MSLESDTAETIDTCGERGIAPVPPRGGKQAAHNAVKTDQTRHQAQRAPEPFINREPVIRVQASRHANEEHAAPPTGPAALDSHAIERFTRQLLTQPETTLQQEFEHLFEVGHAPSDVFDGLLAGTAKALGRRWEDDECSFADVTLGMSIVHRLLRDYSSLLSAQLDPTPGNPVIFVTPIPGETHIFASALLAEHFRAAGWRVISGIHAKYRTIMDSVSENHVDVAAVTLASGDKMQELGKLVQQLREHSKANDLRVLVGGPPFDAQPALYKTVGADATAKTAWSALDVARRLIAG
ncbi:MAG: cobalamin-dependent protein [Pseudomonadota bacterium]